MTDTSKRVLVIVAHPDDAEFGCAATVAKWVKEGREVGYVVLTNGDKGSSDRGMTSERLVRIRIEEQRNAARTLGVERVEFLGFPDGELENTREVRRAVTAEIRRFRPDLVVAQNPQRTANLYVSHRDHRTAGDAVLDCVYPLARDHLSFPELLAQGLEPHKVHEVYLVGVENPDVVVDISDTIELKLKALACHTSQMRDFARVEAWVRERAAKLGKPKGYAYAEAFHRIGIPS
ncbi:MAG: PIG-L family deacetylase [Candidatus Rokubacteria bacterium]|nr:PIG-L family deacetylase [Candidatus Rokubacteria bacterium]